MKAILLAEKNQSVQRIDAPLPTAGPDEILINIKAAALNHRDVFIQQGLYPGIKLPAILGSDGAGVVMDVGEGVEDVSQARDRQILGLVLPAVARPSAGTGRRDARRPVRVVHDGTHRARPTQRTRFGPQDSLIVRTAPKRCPRE